VTGRVIAAALLLWLTGCGGDIEPGRTESSRERIEGLQLARVEMRQQGVARSLPAVVEAAQRGVLVARLDGRVGQLPVREGDRVKAGALLLTLTENPAADRLAEARAAESAAEAGLAAAAAQRELALQDRERYRPLRERNVVTPQEFDRVVTAAKVAEEAEVAARQQVQQARAARAAAETAYGYTRITAPLAGRVASLQVKSGSTVLPGSPLLVIEGETGWQVKAEVPESLAGVIGIGTELPVNLPALKRSLNGRVSEISPAADPRSHSLTVKLDLAGDTNGLVAGMFARVSPQLGERQALSVPLSALVRRGQLSGVYVVEDGILHYRLVRAGAVSDGQVEVLAGLDGGEQLVVSGVERARHGATVGN